MIVLIREKKDYREYQNDRKKYRLKDWMSSSALDISQLSDQIEIAENEEHHLEIE